MRRRSVGGERQARSGTLANDDLDMDEPGARTCPVCDAVTGTVRSLCSDECVREAVHEIDHLSARRKHLRKLVRRRGVDTRSLPSQAGRDADADARELAEVAARTDELMAALMATRRGGPVADGPGPTPDTVGAS